MWSPGEVIAFVLMRRVRSRVLESLGPILGVGSRRLKHSKLIRQLRIELWQEIAARRTCCSNDPGILPTPPDRTNGATVPLQLHDWPSGTPHVQHLDVWRVGLERREVIRIVRVKRQP